MRHSSRTELSRKFPLGSPKDKVMSRANSAFHWRAHRSSIARLDLSKPARGRSSFRRYECVITARRSVLIRAKSTRQYNFERHKLWRMKKNRLPLAGKGVILGVGGCFFYSALRSPRACSLLFLPKCFVLRIRAAAVIIRFCGDPGGYLGVVSNPIGNDLRRPCDVAM